MAKARITLNDTGPLTYSGNGYENIQRNQAIITSKDEDIIHFSSTPGFTVDMLEGKHPKAAVEDDEEEAPAPKKGKKRSAPPPPVDDEEEGEDDEEEDEDEDQDGPVDGDLTEADLMKQNKGPLLELAAERGVKANNSMNKDQIVAAILAAKKD